MSCDNPQLDQKLADVTKPSRSSFIIYSVYNVVIHVQTRLLQTSFTPKNCSLELAQSEG